MRNKELYVWTARVATKPAKTRTVFPLCLVCFFFWGGGAFYTRGRGSFWPCGAIGGARAGLFRQTDKAAARRRRGCWRPDQGRGVGNGGNSGAGWAAPQIGGGTEIHFAAMAKPRAEDTE